MKARKIDFNAPVVLGFTFVSFAVFVLSMLTQGRFGEFFALRKTSWLSPMQYVRLFSHVVTHLTFSHLSGNIMLVLAIGPMVEEKYGSRGTLIMILFTALVTGLVNILVFPNTILLGASGIVFMLILVASFANIREDTIPLTVILVAAFYIGNEIVTGFTVQDNISHTTHIIGGICGASFGYLLNKNTNRGIRSRRRS